MFEHLFWCSNIFLHYRKHCFGWYIFDCRFNHWFWLGRLSTKSLNLRLPWGVHCSRNAKGCALQGQIWMGAHLNYRIAQPGPNKLIDLCGLGWCHGKIAWNLWFPSGKHILKMFEHVLRRKSVNSEMFEHCFGCSNIFLHYRECSNILSDCKSLTVGLITGASIFIYCRVIVMLWASPWFGRQLGNPRVCQFTIGFWLGRLSTKSLNLRLPWGVQCSLRQLLQHRCEVWNCVGDSVLPPLHVD